MTRITLETSSTGRLEEPVDRLLAALFRSFPEPAPTWPGRATKRGGSRATPYRVRAKLWTGRWQCWLVLTPPTLRMNNSGGSTPGGWKWSGSGLAAVLGICRPCILA